jgi:hypothetical protein
MKYLEFPNLETIDTIRQEGFRPQVINCVVHNRMVLLTYTQKYDVWGMVQGGINNGVQTIDAAKQELESELGPNFAQKCTIDEEGALGENRIQFPQHNHGMRELVTDAGEPQLMVGKHFFYILVNAEDDTIDLTQTEFDDIAWCNRQQAYHIIDNIYQSGKRRMLMDILSVLIDNNIID